MADDLDLLTAPVAKGKSLMQKLKKDMSRESKQSRNSEHGRPYMHPESGGSTSRMPYTLGVQSDEPLPLRVSSGIQEPLPHHELEPLTRTTGRRRHTRRSIKRAMYDDIDGVEMEYRGTPVSSVAGSEAGSRSGSLVHGLSGQYNTFTSQGHSGHHEVQHNQNTTGQYTKINRAHVAASQNTRRQQLSAEGSFKSVRWSRDTTLPDHDNDGVISLNRERPTDQRDGPRVTGNSRQRTQVDHQETRDPWTIYRSRDTYFVYGPTLRANNPPQEAPGCCGWWDEMWAPYGGFCRITSPWIFATLSLLFLANIFFITAFVTNHWGILHVVHNDQITPMSGDHVINDKPKMRFNETSYMQWIWNTWNGIPNTVYYDNEPDVPPSEGAPPEMQPIEVIPEPEDINRKLHIHVVNRMKTAGTTSEHWKFGLWQCCRSTDGLCLGPRFAPFYGVTRTFSVLTLFLLILCFAWLLGHTLEKLLDYDTCTMSCLISMCYIAAIFTMLSVICFGMIWPVEFAKEYDGTDPELSFSFYMAAMSIPLTLGAAVCSTIDLKTGLDEIREQEQFYSDPDNFTDQLMSDIPTDNISRSRSQKKKRTGQSPYLYESQA